MTVNIRQAIINAVRVGVRGGVALVLGWSASRWGVDLSALFESFMAAIEMPVSFETAVMAVQGVATAAVSGLLLIAERRWPRLTTVLSLGFRTEAPSYPSRPKAA